MKNLDSTWPLSTSKAIDAVCNDGLWKLKAKFGCPSKFHSISLTPWWSAYKALKWWRTLWTVFGDEWNRARLCAGFNSVQHDVFYHRDASHTKETNRIAKGNAALAVTWKYLGSWWNKARYKDDSVKLQFCQRFYMHARPGQFTSVMLNYLTTSTQTAWGTS